jgi:outer membrane protein OmpA-like peptidoglycan-associated protein
MKTQIPNLGAIGFYFFFLIGAALLRAQVTVSVNPANVQDARVLFANPAIAVTAPARAYLGIKFIYPGVMPNNSFGLKSPFFNFSIPHLGQYDFGAGLHGRYFNTPLFQEGRIGGIVARKFTERIAIGLDVSLLFKSYARENFDLVDPDDPVFRNGTSIVVFDPGIGLHAQVHEKLALAASLSHFTQPDVALGNSEFKLPFEALLGLSYLHHFFRLDAGAHLWQEQMYPTLGAEIFSPHSGRLRFGYGLENLLFEGQLSLRSNASFFYSFNLPTSDLGLVSAGSHEVGFIYAFAPPSRGESEQRANELTLLSDVNLQTIDFNQPAQYRIGLARKPKFIGRVRLGTNELPPGLTADFSPPEIGPDEVSLLTLWAKPGLPPGEYAVDVVGRLHPKTSAESPSETLRLLPLRVVVKPKPRLLASVRATTDHVLFTELREVQQELPIIPRIFFPKNSTELVPTRYDLLTPEQQKKFSSDVREINAAYRNLLNIIADRLRANPSKRVILKGYSSGPTIEKEPAALSRQRAENVRDYLVHAAGVRPGQVNVESGILDPREAGARDPLRLEELQRVDIEVQAEDEEILLAPITFEKKEADATPEQCGFLTMDSFAEAGVAAWQLSILAGNDTVGVLEGKDALPDTIWWDWQFGTDRGTKFWQEIRYSLWLQDRVGQQISTPWQKIRSRRAQQQSIQVERIPIILFAFDEYEMDRTSRRLQTKLRQIAGKLRNDPKAMALLYGHTDAIGEEEHNRQLSLRRAQNVANEIAKSGISASRLSTFGLSESQPLADNRLPEGRMLNRRVEVHIRHSGEIAGK